jgi:hypothetical protein
MNTLKLTLLSLLLTGPALWADSPAIAPPTTPNPPAKAQFQSADPLAEALPILQSNYVDFKTLSYKPGDHLSDLIARSSGKISLGPPEVSERIPIITADLPDGIIYWRLASFTPKKDWADLAGDLKTMIEFQHAVGAILDLRSNIAPDDYAGAAQVLNFFVPTDGTLVKYLPQKGDGVFHLPLPIPDRVFQGPLIVLTNGQTAGAAEALATCLKADGALVVGRTTAGKASLFQADELFSGQILRFAIAQTFLADGTPLLGHPVVPDIALTVDDRVEKAALILIKDNHIDDVIQESAERHRMSEASLVQGQDPEWDDYLASLEQKPVLLSLPAIHDTALISALDSLKAIRLSQKSLPAQTTANASPPASSSVQ